MKDTKKIKRINSKNSIAESMNENAFLERKLVYELLSNSIRDIALRAPIGTPKYMFDKYIEMVSPDRTTSELIYKKPNLLGVIKAAYKLGIAAGKIKGAKEKVAEIKAAVRVVKNADVEYIFNSPRGGRGGSLEIRKEHIEKGEHGR